MGIRSSEISACAAADTAARRTVFRYVWPHRTPSFRRHICRDCRGSQHISVRRCARPL